MLNMFKKESLPKSFLLFRQLMRTCVLFLTDVVTTDKGPVLNSSSSRRSNSSGVISDLGLFNVVDPDAILMIFSKLKFRIRVNSRRQIYFIYKTSVAKGLNLKNATNLPNHAKNHATKKTLKRSHIFGQRRHNFDQLKIFSIAFFSQKIRNCHDLGKRRHNLS